MVPPPLPPTRTPTPRVVVVVVVVVVVWKVRNKRVWENITFVARRLPRQGRIVIRTYIAHLDSIPNGKFAIYN
jgi:hypothetical protein